MAPQQRLQVFNRIKPSAYYFNSGQDSYDMLVIHYFENHGVQKSDHYCFVNFILLVMYFFMLERRHQYNHSTDNVIQVSSYHTRAGYGAPATRLKL